jgi:tetratricopeptide (TPR) repeat protein
MSTFIAQLKAQLEQADWPVVFAALRSQPSLWQSLQNSHLGKQALANAEGASDHFSPAYLGLTSIGQQEIFSSLRETPLKAVPEKLRYQAATAFEEMAAIGDDQQDSAPGIEQATYLALALRERNRLAESWEQLLDDLSFAPLSFWRLSLACLFGLIPEPANLMTELLAKNKAVKVRELGIRALLGNPLSPQDQYSLLKKASAQFSFGHKLQLLREISQHRPTLAAMLAKDLLETVPQTGDGSEGIAQLANLLQQSEIHQISGQHDEALPLLSEAWESSQRLQANLAASLAESASHNDDHVTEMAALEQATLLDPDNAKLNAELQAKQLEDGKPDVNRVSADYSQHPISLISASRVAHKNGDLAEAQSFAQAAFDVAKKDQSITGQKQIEIFHDIIPLLLEVDLAALAKQAADMIAASNPEDAHSAHLLSLAEQAVGDNENALQSAHLAVALDPESSAYRRFLALALQANESFDEAYEEWEILVKGQEQVEFTDQFAVAETAFLSGRTQHSAEICQLLIESDSSNAELFTLLGKSLLAEQNAEGATFLASATELSPEMAEAWLALAEYQQNTGDADLAIKSLLTAADNIKDSPEIYAALANNYLESGNKEDALDNMRSANSLIAKQVGQSTLGQKVALQLGELEIDLGQNAEARKTLSQAHMAYPANVGLAQSYGRLLLDLKQYKEALSALMSARQSDPNNLSLQLDSARAHLSAGLQLEKGLSLLDTVLAQQPNNVDAKILRAETQLALGQVDEGRKVFDALLTSHKNVEGELYKRLSLGKASAEAKGGLVSEAITTLEALQKLNPNDLGVLRAVCSAYCDSGRQEEAFQIAQQVYLSTDHDEKTVIWYSEMAQQAGKGTEAENALSKAIHSGDQSFPVVFQLARLQWEAGKKSSARENFAIILKSASPEIYHLLDIAEFFRSQGEAKQATIYIQKAIDISGASDASLFKKLADVLIEGKQIPQALKNIEHAINLAPNNPHYLVKKSNYLDQLDRPKAALQSLDEALELLPTDSELLEAKARMLIDSSDWASALNYAEKAQMNNKGNVELLLFAANLAITCLQNDRARSMISQSPTPKNHFELASLMAGLAMSSGDIKSAGQTIAMLSPENEKHPRLLALKTRLAISEERHSEADDLFTKTLKALGTFNAQQKGSPDYLSTLFAVALAAQMMNSWPTAIKLFKQVAANSPSEAAVQFATAKALIQRAEWQQLCQASNAVRHAPGEIALSKASHRASLEALKRAHDGSPFAGSRAEIARWKTRADMRFDPKSGNQNLAVDFPQDAAEAAALVFAAQQSDAVSTLEKKSEAFGQSPEVLIELSQAYASKDAALAMQWAKKASQLARQQTPYYMILAQIAWTAGDIKSALKAAEKALALWPKEPRWHSLYAIWLQKQGEQELAIEHLEESLALDPEYAQVNYELGLAYMQVGAIDKAASSLNNAHQLDTDNAHYLLSLAQAQQQLGDLSSAKHSAKRAYKLDGQSVSALVIQAELALLEGQAKKATSIIKQAIDQNPEDLQTIKILAETRLAQGKAEEAISILEQAQEKAEDAIPLQIRRAQILPKSRGEGSDLTALQTLNERYPERADVAMALSEVMAKAGDLTQATQVAHKAMRFSKQLPALNQAHLHLHLGQLLKHDGQLDQALYHLDEASKVAKHLAEIHLERGQVFLARRQHAQAMEAFEQASEAAPNDAQPHLLAAQALKEAKDYAAAEKGLRRAAELAPSDRSIQRQLASLIALNLVHQPEQIGNAS